jgi:hypothetical protein
MMPNLGNRVVFLITMKALGTKVKAPARGFNQVHDRLYFTQAFIPEKPITEGLLYT